MTCCRGSLLVMAVLLGGLVLPLLAGERGEGCSTAVFGAGATRSGGPMLWKNRDTEVRANKAVFVSAQPFSYLALVNAGQPGGRFAYAGLNSAGLGIMNSVAVNLPRKGGELADLEGLLMAEILRTCSETSQVEAFLRANLGGELGAQANFGVIDASGEAVIFEVHNHGIERLDASTAPGGVLANTNFSRSGARDEGAGYLRFERVKAILSSANNQKFTPAFVMEKLARDWGHPLLLHPGLADLSGWDPQTPRWISTRDTLCRSDTAAAVVIAGRRPGADSPPATFWVMLGEPLATVAVPLWVEAKEVPALLSEGLEAPLNREALRIKRILRPFSEPDKAGYLDLSRLENQRKTGFLAGLLRVEQEIVAKTEAFLARPRSRDELSRFQAEMAARAMTALEQVR